MAGLEIEIGGVIPEWGKKSGEAGTKIHSRGCVLQSERLQHKEEIFFLMFVSDFKPVIRK